MVPLRHHGHATGCDMSDGAQLTRNGNVRGRVVITVRVPEPLLRQIDSYIETRDVPISRNNWLLEAAVEKLDRHWPDRREGDGS